MKVVLAIDSFKGSLSSLDAADAAADGIRQAYPEAQTVKIPIADGGEGTVEALASQEGARLVKIPVRDPLGRPAQAVYAILPSGCAVMEMAKASGITFLTKDELNPLKTSTYGTGEMIRHALENGAKDFVMGIGGSATNDGGMGMLAALGFEFFDENSKPVKEYGGENLARVRKIETSGAMPELREARFTILCDVSNPFCGKNGAAHVFSPQKGATPEIVERLDNGMLSYAETIESQFGKKIKDASGAGAAGGLGGAFLAFFNAELKNGIEGILDALGFDEKIEGADYIVTGEGRLDFQSGMGKAPCGIAKRAAKKGIPVIALGGGITADAKNLYSTNICSMFSICRCPTSLEDAMEKRNAAENMADVCENIFRLIKISESK